MMIALLGRSRDCSEEYLGKPRITFYANEAMLNYY